jgi:integrase/recombinase XerD
LIPHYHNAAWLPNEEQWRAVLDAGYSEALHNRARLAMSYDATLRREELRSLAVADIDPSQRLLRIRAETTKNHQERVVPHSFTYRYILL